MEEDIKILEEFIKINREMFEEFDGNLHLSNEIINAIENLINKNKEQENFIVKIITINETNR